MNTMRQNTRSQHERHACTTQHPRHGAVLITLVIMLVIVGLLAIGLTQQILARHRLQAIQQRHLQVAELARSGCQRAAAQLARSADYGGEKWTVTGKQLASDQSAVVTISVKEIADQPQGRLVNSTAVWGTAPRSIQHSHEIRIDLNSLPTSQ